jgi:hypothetical protein
MLQRITIEFAVDVPNEGVARDVETRIHREHHAHLCDVIQSVTGYAPLLAPDQRGLTVGSEPVAWNAEEQDWVALDDDGADTGNE